MLITILKWIVVVLMVVYTIYFVIDYVRNKETDYPNGKFAASFVIGFIVNFFDVLGIGSFAPTLALFNLCNMDIPEKKIGPTMNIGVSSVVLLEAYLFLNGVPVDAVTLIAIEISALIGSFFGKKLLVSISENLTRVVMGLGLALAGILMLLSKAGLYPMGGDLNGLTGWKLIVACIVGFILGAVVIFGIGPYAPCMAVVYLLGMSPICAFPIMCTMGGLTSTNVSFQSIKAGLYVRKPAMGMMIAGFGGVIVAYYLVKSMSLSTLTWVVIIAVIYASYNLLSKAYKSRKAPQAN